jgi:hypothetical protein
VDYRAEVAEGALLAKIDDALYAADVAGADAQKKQAQAQTKIGTVIVRNTRRIGLLLSSSYPYQGLFAQVTRALRT